MELIYRKEMKKQNQIYGIIFFSLLMLLSGCEMLDSLLIKKQNHPEYINKFLTNPTCTPPCWEHITPGITKPEEAKIYLKSVPEVFDVEFKSTTSTNKIYLAWFFYDSADSGAAGGDLEKINYISLGINSDLRLSEIVKAYGEPTHVKVSMCKPDFGYYCPIYLIYDNFKMVLATYSRTSDPDKNGIKISKNSRILEIGFYIGSGQPDPEHNYPFPLPVQFYEWHGYGKYPY